MKEISAMTKCKVRECSIGTITEPFMMVIGKMGNERVKEHGKEGLLLILVHGELENQKGGESKPMTQGAVMREIFWPAKNMVKELNILATETSTLDNM
jgi:hypothetical protein